MAGGVGPCGTPKPEDAEVPLGGVDRALEWRRRRESAPVLKRGGSGGDTRGGRARRGGGGCRGGGVDDLGRGTDWRDGGGGGIEFREWGELGPLGGRGKGWRGEGRVGEAVVGREVVVRREALPAVGEGAHRRAAVETLAAVESAELGRASRRAVFRGKRKECDLFLFYFFLAFLGFSLLFLVHFFAAVCV